MKEPTYTAAVLTGPRKIELQKREAPVLGPGEALVRVRFAGICGTDLALHSGDYTAALPLVPGHEFAGEVTAVGTSIDPELIGSRVTGEINITCLSRGDKNLCPACHHGLANHCQSRSVLGIVNYDGAFAEFLKLPVRNLHLLPEAIPLHYGVFAEPLAAAIQTFELASVSAGETVVVLGAGRLGVLTCRVASLKGARVVAVSRSPYKLQLAKKFGAHVLLDATESDVRQEILTLTGGLGADLVVEATGTPNGFTEAQGLVRPKGTICLKSTPGSQTADFPLTRAVVDEIRIQCSRCGPFGKAIRMMVRHELEMDALISDIVPLKDVTVALEAARTRFKILLKAP